MSACPHWQTVLLVVGWLAESRCCCSIDEYEPLGQWRHTCHSCRRGCCPCSRDGVVCSSVLWLGDLLILPLADLPCCLQLQELLLFWQPQGFLETTSSCAQGQLITCLFGFGTVATSGSQWACHSINEFVSLWGWGVL